MSEAQWLIVLISSCMGLVVLVLLLVWRISARLVRIERLIAADRPVAGDLPPSPAEVSAGGAFEAFLAEDPDRREMTKSEQFSAYRQWRAEKGLNWSNSGDHP